MNPLLSLLSTLARKAVVACSASLSS